MDGYSNDIMTSLITLSIGTATPITIDLLGAAYQNITTPITFRIYGWGLILGTLSINNFNCNGTVSANTTTWSGSAWSNGFPTLSTHTIIAGNYNTATGGNQIALEPAL